MITLSMPQEENQLRPRITVFGVGGAGGNAVNNMIRSNLEGVEFVVANTDAQALAGSHAERRIQLGATVTRGLGAGSRPDVGRASAEEQLDEIGAYLEDSNMVFITAGMGGGTGTGAAPVIARAARERGILTVAVVTKPFHFEGAHRMRTAEAGIAELQQYVDTLIIIPNQNLFRVANEKTTFADAFKMADDVLHSGVRGVTDLMVMPGLINLDFADIRSVMSEMGKAMMGTGEATGDRRAVEAAEAAISNPLLDDVSMKGARGVLINITGGLDMTLFEVDEAANRIRDEVDPDANIIFGSTFDQSMEGTMRVSVVATGIEGAEAVRPQPQVQQPVQPARPTSLNVVTGGRKAPMPSPYTTRHEPRPATADYHATLVASPQAPVAPATAQAQPMQQPAPQQPAYTGSAARALAPEPQLAEPVHAQPAARAEVEAAPVRQPAPRAPQAPLAGERRDGRFFAPEPADAGQRAPMPATHPESFVAPRDAGERTRASLFQRMTTNIGGVARRVMSGEEVEQPRRRPAPPVAQPRTGETAIRPAAADGEEDRLDIPAFLRRQAN